MPFRNFIYFIFICIILYFPSCGNKYTRNNTIIKAEKLIFSNPDSAYQILNSFKEKNSLSKRDYAAWCLHFTHAQYKLYLEIKSDSLIRNAVEYYTNSNENYYAGMSYYLWGCILEQDGKSRNAMSSYKKADDLIQSSNDYNLQGLIKYKIGFIYLLDEYYSESELYIDEALSIFKKHGNKKYLYYCYRTKAELIYLQEKPISDVLRYSDLSEKLSVSEKDTAFYLNVLVFKGKVLLESEPKKSIKYLLKAFNGSAENKTYISTLLSFAYSKINMPDSAKFYKKFQSKDESDLNIILLKNIADAYVYNCKGNIDSAFLFLEKAYKLRENLYKDNFKQQLVRIDKQYDLSKKEAEKAKLEIKNQKSIILIAFLSITVLAVLLILLFITNLNKKRQATLILEKQQLEFEVKTKQVENDKKLKILLSNLQNKIDNTLHFKKLQLNLSKTDKKEEFIADITRQAVLTDKEWQFYIDEANELFSGNIAKLKLEFPQLTNADLIVVSLICIGIDITNSILLLDYANINTMYIRRNRIKKHLGLDNSTDLEKWLRNYVISPLETNQNQHNPSH